MSCVKVDSSAIISAMKINQIIRELGGPVSVGRHLGIRSQAISLWVIKDRIPAERVPQLERLARQIGSRVRAEHMRPDVDWGVLRSTAPEV